MSVVVCSWLGSYPVHPFSPSDEIYQYKYLKVQVIVFDKCSIKFDIMAKSIDVFAVRISAISAFQPMIPCDLFL